MIRSGLGVALMLTVLALPAQRRREAQTPPPPAPPSATSQQGAPAQRLATQAEALYNLAVKYGDPSIALLALYHRITDKPNDLALRDSLMGLYYALGFYTQALNVINDLKDSKYENLRTLEVEALSFRALNRLKESLEAYEKLYAKAPSLFTQYQIATLQYQLKRVAECALTLQQIQQNPKASEEKVVITLGENQQEEVILLAAAQNIQGVVLLEQKEYAAAKTAFEKALQTAPNFQLAKQNLQVVERQMKQPAVGETPPANTPRPAAGR